MFAAGLIALAFFLQAFTASQKHSLTWDEPSFMSAGVVYLTRGDFRFNSSHPPLAQVLEALPLLVAGLRDPGRSYEDYDALGNPVAVLGRELIFFGGIDPARLATLARLPITILGTFLVIAAFGWARRLYSDRAALVAAALCAFCPNLIAHGGVATEDLACTFFMFLAVWTFHRVAPDASTSPWRDWIICGLVTGLALSAKYTSVLLLPIYGLIAIATWRTSRQSWKRGLQGSMIVAAAALLVITISYGSLSGVAIYLRGMGTIYQDLDGIPPALLLGTWAKSRWYYYLVALPLKISLPVLVLIAAGVVVLLREPARRRNAAFILIPPAVILAVTMFDPANFGLRRVLPVLPFLFLAAAAAADRALASGRRFAMPALALALTWTIAETMWIYPHHLSYFSAVAGGPGNGHKLLSDSNIDWGQDLPALAAWRRDHPDENPFYLAYFGTSIPSTYGVSARRPPRIEAKGPQPPGTYAMSVHLLQSLQREAAEVGAGLDWLGTRTPIGRAGYSIFIYRIE